MAPRPLDTPSRPRPVLVAVGLVTVLAAACTPDADPTVTAPSVTAPVTEDATVGGDASVDVVHAEEVPPLHPSVDTYDAGRVVLTAADGTTHQVAVRIARTAAERAHGLMEVPALPDGAGMWFAYDQDRTGGFWMKGTLVPLAITYVGADDRIVDVADAVPCEADPCPVFSPDAAYRSVLEVPAGFLDRIGVGIGDTVRLVAS